MIGRVRRQSSLFYAAFGAEASLIKDDLLDELDPLLEDEALLEVVTDARDQLARLAGLVLPLADYVSTDCAEQLQALVPAIQDASEVPSGLLPAVYGA